MSEVQIGAIAFEPQGLVISYMRIPDDVRVQGTAVMQHQLQLSAEHGDYADDARSLHDKAVRVLLNALEDFNDSEPFIPTSPDDDDERGMGE